MVHIKHLKPFMLSTMLICASATFAGPEDWAGDFYIFDSYGMQSTVSHGAKGISLDIGNTHIRVGQTYSFSNNTCIGNLCATQSGSLSKDMNVDTFANEVRKLGGLFSGYSVNLGPNYKP